MNRKQQVAVAGVAVFLGVVIAVVVVAVSSLEAARLQHSVPNAIFVSAPRYCFHGINRGDGVSGRGAIVDSLDGHIPYWLPPGFGLSGAYEGFEGDYSRFIGPDGAMQAWTEWSDGHCRFVTLEYFPGWKAKPVWHRDFDIPDAQFGPILGIARGIQYTVGVRGGVVTARMDGLSEDEAARVVRSIRR